MLKDEEFAVIAEEFEKKETTLQQFGEQVRPETLYEDIYTDTEQIVPVVFIDDDETKHIVKMSIDEAIEVSRDRNDVLLGGTTYFKGYISKNTAKDILAFIIDMDNVWNGVLLAALQNDWNTDTEEIPKPTYIVNSGTGCHLYFVLDEPLPHYQCNSLAIDKLYRTLAVQQTTCRIFLQKQVQWFGQDFRMAGSLNKYGFTNSVYRVGDKWNIEMLSAAVGLPDLEFTKYGDLRRKKRRVDREKRSYKRTGWHTNRAFYDYSVNRCRTETHEGNRYMSMCALTCIAWKCNVPIEEVYQDLLSLLPEYNKGAKRQIKPSEIEHALKMYNDRALVATRDRLEDWQGWTYKPIKRNGRKQATHLKIARSTLAIMNEDKGETLQGRPKGSGTAKQKVHDWRSSHPEGKKIDCHRDTNLDPKTIRKWWNE